MYNYGLVKFLQAKKLKSNECINAFLTAEGITDFQAKHHHRVNDYIENNWTKFASFVDRGIKDGTLHGKPVKLNTYYDEMEEYNNIVKNEFKEANLNQQQQELFDYIRRKGVGKLMSFLMKKEVVPTRKDLSFKSKTLRWMPLVNQAIENGFTKFNF